MRKACSARGARCGKESTPSGARPSRSAAARTGALAPTTRSFASVGCDKSSPGEIDGEKPDVAPATTLNRRVGSGGQHRRSTIANRESTILSHPVEWAKAIARRMALVVNPPRPTSGRKVRTGQGTVVGNANPARAEGKCHRKETAGETSKSQKAKNGITW